MQKLNEKQVPDFDVITFHRRICGQVLAVNETTGQSRFLTEKEKVLMQEIDPGYADTKHTGDFRLSDFIKPLHTSVFSFNSPRQFPTENIPALL